MEGNRTVKVLIKKLLDNPFLPLLFTSETIKALVIEGPNLTALKLLVLTVASMVIWVLSDAISVDVEKGNIIG